MAAHALAMAAHALGLTLAEPLESPRGPLALKDVLQQIPRGDAGPSDDSDGHDGDDDGDVCVASS